MCCRRHEHQLPDPLPAYGIGNHPEALLVLGGKPPDAERLHRSLRGPDVVCPNVEV